MTAEPDLLPMPNCDYLLPVGPGHADIVMWSETKMHAYARANVARATAAKDAKIEALRAEVATWEGLHASEVQVRQRWQARAERLAEALRDAADDIDAGVPPEDAAAHLRARADLLRDQEEGK